MVPFLFQQRRGSKKYCTSGDESRKDINHNDPNILIFSHSLSLSLFLSPSLSLTKKISKLVVILKICMKGLVFNFDFFFLNLYLIDKTDNLKLEFWCILLSYRVDFHNILLMVLSFCHNLPISNKILASFERNPQTIS